MVTCVDGSACTFLGSVLACSPVLCTSKIAQSPLSWDNSTCFATKKAGYKMSVFKTLEERISEALSLYPTSSDNVVRDPPTDDQVGTKAL